MRPDAHSSAQMRIISRTCNCSITWITAATIIILPLPATLLHTHTLKPLHRQTACCQEAWRFNRTAALLATQAKAATSSCATLHPAAWHTLILLSVWLLGWLFTRHLLSPSASALSPPILQLFSSPLSSLMSPSDSSSSSFIPHSQVLHLFELNGFESCSVPLPPFSFPALGTTPLYSIAVRDVMWWDVMRWIEEVELKWMNKLHYPHSTAQHYPHTHTVQHSICFPWAHVRTSPLFNTMHAYPLNTHFSSSVQCSLYKSDWLVVLRGIRSFCNLIFLVKSTIQFEYRTYFHFPPSSLFLWHANTQTNKQTN